MMDQMLYVSSSGMRQIMHAQTVQMNNLANVNTTGFRADIAEATNQATIENAGDSRVYTDIGKNRFSIEQGGVRTTGNDLDVAVVGDGWIAVQNIDGDDAMTRSGALQLSSEGILQTRSGNPVLGSGGPVTIPAYEKLEIATDGTISIVPQGQGAESLVQLDRIRLVNPEHEVIKKSEDGLFYITDGQPMTADPEVKLATTALEGSNVNAVSTMASIMDLSRQYEMQVKLMKVAEDDANASAQIMQVE